METRRIEMGSRTVVFEFESGWNQTGETDDVMFGIFAQLTVDYEDGVRPNAYEWMANVWKKWISGGSISSVPAFRCHIEPNGAHWSMAPEWKLSERNEVQ